MKDKTQFITDSGVNAWLNIQLAGSYQVAAVFLLWTFPAAYDNSVGGAVAGTSIRVGTSATVTKNAVCKSGINNQGIFLCDEPLTGTYLGLVRESTSKEWFVWAEIRAYELLPIVITTSMLSTNTMPNDSLKNSLSFSMASVAKALATDLVFSATSAGQPVYWMAKFAASTNIGYVLVVG